MHVYAHEEPSLLLSVAVRFKALLLGPLQGCTLLKSTFAFLMLTGGTVLGFMEVHGMYQREAEQARPSDDHHHAYKSHTIIQCLGVIQLEMLSTVCQLHNTSRGDS